MSSIRPDLIERPNRAQTERDGNVQIIVKGVSADLLHVILVCNDFVLPSVKIFNFQTPKQRVLVSAAKQASVDQLHLSFVSGLSVPELFSDSRPLQCRRQRTWSSRSLRDPSLPSHGGEQVLNSCSRRQENETHISCPASPPPSRLLISGIINAHDCGGTVACPAPFWWYYALPAVFCSATNILMNLVSATQLSGRSGVFDDGNNKKAVLWFMCMLAGSFCCIGGAIWILAQQYGIGSTGSEWPGIALLLQTIFVTVSGLLFFFGRPKGTYSTM